MKLKKEYLLGIIPVLLIMIIIWFLNLNQDIKNSIESTKQSDYYMNIFNKDKRNYNKSDIINLFSKETITKFQNTNVYKPEIANEYENLDLTVISLDEKTPASELNEYVKIGFPTKLKQVDEFNKLGYVGDPFYELQKILKGSPTSVDCSEFIAYDFERNNYSERMQNCIKDINGKDKDYLTNIAHKYLEKLDIYKEFYNANKNALKFITPNKVKIVNINSKDKFIFREASFINNLRKNIFAIDTYEKNTFIQNLRNAHFNENKINIIKGYLK